MKATTLLRVLLVALLLLVASSYLPPRRTAERPAAPPPLSQVLVRDQLLAELQMAEAPSAVGFPIVVSRVEYQDVRSAVVPGLVYHWASYSPQGIVPPAPSYALVGERNGWILPIRNAASWSLLAQEWAPASAKVAVDACVEMQVAVARQGAHTIPIPLENRAADSGLMDDERERVWSRVREPVSVTPPSSADPRWTVLVWALIQGPERGAVRYRCTFPQHPASARVGARISVVDSIPLVRIPLL